jgi:hypothetical protein
MLSSQSAPATPPPAPFSFQDADFQARCSAAGVIKCWGFDDPSTDLVLNKHVFAGNCTTPSQDTITKASGAGALKFSLPVSCPPSADLAGRWEPQGSEGGGAFNGRSFAGGDTFYVQFRMRITSSMLTNQWDSSWKFFEILYNSSYYGHLALVWVNYYTSGFISGYHGASNIIIGTAQADGCLGPNMPEGCIAEPYPPYAIQQTTDGRGSGDGRCDYKDTSNYPGDCVRFIPDTWMTFYYKVTYGAKNQYNSQVQGWMMKDGDADFTQFLDTGPKFLLGGGVSNELGGDVFNTLNFSTYMTRLSSCGPGCQDAAMWIDEVVISTQPIAQPLPTFADDEPPSVTITSPSDGESILRLNQEKLSPVN